MLEIKKFQFFKKLPQKSHSSVYLKSGIIHNSPYSCTNIWATFAGKLAVKTYQILPNLVTLDWRPSQDLCQIF